MKRVGYIIEEITERKNIEDSFDTVMSKASAKGSYAWLRIMESREIVIDEIIASIECDMFSVNRMYEFTVEECGKTREIQSVSLTDRIALNAIMTVVGKYLRRRFIRDTFSSIPKRGMHDGLRRMRRWMTEDPEGTKFCYKSDFKKFYHSIDQDILIGYLKRVFKDERLLNTLERIIRILPGGLPIGFRSSQEFGNFYLTLFLDHYMKDHLGVKYYLRYCDDIVILDYSKEKLKEISRHMHDISDGLKLTIKNNERIFEVDKDGVDFLGYVSYHSHVRIRKHIKQRFARKIKHVKSKRRRQQLVGSFYGFAKHGNCCNLFKKLTGISMKEFGEFGINYKPGNGGKWFDCEAIDMNALSNLRITVLDYEVDVKTKHGEGRYLVLVDVEGEHRKFYTNSKRIKQALDEINSRGEIPFITTIKRAKISDHYEYIFT